MFIVKAVRHDGGYSLHEAANVSVEDSKSDGCNGPGQPPYVKADFDVFLYDSASVPFKNVLPVGHGLDHYSCIFVMNERGKTVDTVQHIVREETRRVA